jgi:glutamine synthetase
VKYVHTTVGSEQEYFLIDKDMYLKRKDLLMCGRTLIGAPAPKGQEMEDHYFGVLKPKVADFMHDLDNELWKLGVPAKTKHNEVAPSQHELAPVFEAGNVAVDHNQLTMEVMKKVADRKGYACLLHEKPFKGVNGSGKHDNWSLVTDGGENLLNPGKTHEENFQFMVFLMAIIEAVDDYQDLLRISVATAGNDHRLGANEAPPAIISIFVGDELLGLLDGVKGGKLPEFKKKALMELGTKVLPEFKKDKTDRNRTSPFAFTGNKFEFRMPGSALSVADPNIILNTAVSEALDGIYNALKEVPSDKIEEETMKLLKDMLDKHSRILFDGNGYADEWIEEAHKRGLLDLRSLPDAMPYMLQKKNLELFAKHHILTEEEVKSRYEIYLDNYSKTIHIESLTMQEMVRKDFTEGLVAYLKAVTDETAKKRAIIPDLKCAYEDHIIRVLDESEEKIGELLIKLSEDTCKAEQESDEFKKACMYHEVILNDMEELRKYVDEAEAYIPEDFLPYPTYGELLFSLR